MVNLNSLLKEGAPPELSQFISSCASYDDLVKLVSDPSTLFAVFQNMKVDDSEFLAARLLVRINSSHLANPEVKKVETALRNRGMLNRTYEPDIILNMEGGFPVVAHRAILALESPYFQAIKGFSESQQRTFVMKNMGILPQAYQIVVNYLYLSDEKRKKYLSTMAKTLLLDIAKLADFWQIDELKERCDEELCNHLDELDIQKSNMDSWLAQVNPY